MSDARVSVFCDMACRLGEGPTYDPATDTLYWFDIVGRKLLEQKVSGGEVTAHDLPEMASVLAVIDGERQLVATETGLHVRDVRTGKLALHTPIEADNPETRSNDGRVHPSGALWIGTMGKSHAHRAGAIYWFFKSELRRIFPEISIPNSICFSADGKTGFYTDTSRNILFRVDCDPANGLPVGEPKVFVDKRGKKGGIDGSVMDADGILWNASWGEACVNAYAPDGALVRSIPLPATQVSCPAFIGSRADRLAVTSAFDGLDDAARAADPQAGRTFLIDMPVNGRFEPKVLL
jgi:sugar lactone lactonase YvrE